MSTEEVWCSIDFLGVLLLVAPANQSGSSRATLYNACSAHGGGGGGGYYEHIGRCSVHWSLQYKSKAFINLLPHMNNGVPRCIEHPHPSVLMISPQMNHDMPLMY